MEEKKIFQQLVDMMAATLVDGFEENLKNLNIAEKMLKEEGGLEELTVEDILSKFQDASHQISGNMLGMYLMVMRLKDKKPEDFQKVLKETLNK